MRLVGHKVSGMIRENFDTSTWAKGFSVASDKTFSIMRCYVTISSKADYPLPDFLKSYHPMFK
jgi:hypothetical protein